MRQVGYKFCARRTRKQRVKDRRHILLCDAAITQRTQERYVFGLNQLMPYLNDIDSCRDLDETISDWIQKCWEEGESLHIINDALCGLQHYHPWVKTRIPLSWRLFKVWRKVEAPNRAPPITLKVIEAWLMYAVDHNDLPFAAMLVLGFFGLLRTGELLQVRAIDIMVGSKAAVISLKDTKTGLRNAAKETVSIQEAVALDILRATLDECKFHKLTKVPIWTKSAESFRNAFKHHCKIFDMVSQNFRPYSLRRGGATWLFQCTGSMELALLKGRWGSSKVAKIYLADGLSYLPGLTFSKKARDMLTFWSLNNQLK